MLCDYGCGTEATYVLKNGKHCCSRRPSGCASLKKRNSVAVKNSYAQERKQYTWNPNSAWSRGKSITPNEEIFVENSHWSNELVKQRIIKDELLEYKCQKCEIDEWQGETLVLDLDHKNGNNTDNRLTNLRFLCPNCHSQTHTYKGRNKNSGKTKVSDQELLTAYNNCSNIRQALIAVGLAAKGGNYERLKKLIAPMVESVDTRDLK